MQPIQIYELVTGENRFFSPFCWATRLAVTHKNIPVKTVPWAFREQAKISFSRQNLVPVIVDDNQSGKWVNDSWAIAEYLEDTYPDSKSLFGGTEGTGMATAWFVQNWFIEGPLDLLMKIVVLDEMKAQPSDLQPWFRETREAMFGPLEEYSEGMRGVPNFQASLEPLRVILRKFPHLGGSTAPSYADIIVFGFFMFAYAISPIRLLDKDDVVYAWRSRMFEAYSGATKEAVGFADSL